MLEKPDLADAEIVARLHDEYGLSISQVDFLPLGADAHTAVYRAVTAEQTPYFLKLRSGDFDETSVMLPRFLFDQGITQIIPPLTTTTRQLWAVLDDFRLSLYPFITGNSGFEVNLPDAAWVEFGAALKRIHSVSPPPDLLNRLQRETYSATWREIVKAFQARVEQEVFDDPISAQLAALLNANRALISDLVARAARLGALVQARPREFVICHADIHAGNLLLAEDGALYIVDWDTVILAPKERDLMFVGGGLGGGGHTPEQETALFYAGYGQTEIDPAALAYFRYERIVEDIAAYCEQIFTSDPANQDRAQGLHQLSSQFLPGAVIDLAYRSDRTLLP